MNARHTASGTDSGYSPEYFALMGSFVLVGLEIFVRGITLALRTYSNCRVPNVYHSLIISSWTHNTLLLHVL